MRLAAVVASLAPALLLLSACGENSVKPEVPPGSEPEPTPVPAPAAPPVTAGYLGEWAASAVQCADARWVVSENGLLTPGGSACQWPPGAVRSGETGWTVQATCTAEGPATPVRLRMVGDGDSLVIEGAPFNPMPLVRCPAPVAEPTARTAG